MFCLDFAAFSVSECFGCVCVRVRARARARVCVCVCERERERELAKLVFFACVSLVCRHVCQYNYV